MLILEFVFNGWVLFPLVSVPFLVFWPEWLMVLMTRDSSAPVGCLSRGFNSLFDLLLGASIESGILGFWKLLWPLVEQGPSGRVVGRDMLMMVRKL